MAGSNLFYSLDKERVLTKAYMVAIAPLGDHGYKVGNYFLDKRIPLTDQSVVYSLGILTDTDFDIAIHEKWGCPIYMYDPTPVCIEYMKKHERDKHLKHFPYGVWTENKTLKFYKPKLGGSASVFAGEEGGAAYFEAECLTMEAIMAQNDHDHINIFKADIEGAALPILMQMEKKNIYPDQIVVEFERPRKDPSKIKAFFEDLTALRSQLDVAGYDEFLLPRENAKYFSLEMLFAKKDKMI